MTSNLARFMKAWVLSALLLVLSPWIYNPATVLAQSSRKPVKVTIATATSGMDFAAIWIADRKGYFKEEGIQFVHVLTRGGAPAIAALLNGDVDFAAVSGTDVVLVRSRGDKVIGLGSSPQALDWNIAASNKWLKSKGLTKSQVKGMTTKAKVKAMKGVTLGAATVGGGPAQVSRYVFKRFGIVPDEDVKFVSVGFGPSRVGALRNGTVDMIVGGIPDTEQPELDGWGVVYIRFGDEIEVFKEYIQTAMMTTESYPRKNPDTARAVLRAIVRGNNLVIDNPDESNKVLFKHYPKIKPAVIKAVMNYVRPKFRKNLRMTRKAWENTQEILLFSKRLKSKADLREGGYWTNKYLP